MSNYDNLIQNGELVDNGEKSGIQAWLVEVSSGSFNILRKNGDFMAFLFAESTSETEMKNKWMWYSNLGKK